MSARPLLNLKDIAIDPELVARVPYGAALYYLALPLAHEENRVSVAMAHPENGGALARLRDLLHMEVVPVRGAPEAIRAALQPFQPREGASAPKILAWARQPDQTRHVVAWAQLFAATAPDSAFHLAAPELEVAAVLALARQDRYSLTVISTPQADVKHVLSQATTPVALVGEARRPVQRILIVLRGFASDEYSLAWITPLARHTGAEVTLMPLLDPDAGPLHQMLNGHGARWEHMGVCTQRLAEQGIPTHLKLREGRMAQQISAEVAEGDYDLLVIPAEGYGEFVDTVLAEMERSPASAHCSVLVMKPTGA